MIRVIAAGMLVTLLIPPAGPADASFRMTEIQRDWGVVYAVRVADMNGDKRPDVVAINPSQLAWFENPTWQRHVIADGATPRDNVTIAAADIDGDGRPEIAIGAAWNPRNTTSGGTLHLGVRSAPDGRAPWRVSSIFEEPTLHRIQWADVDADRRPELVVTPLHGRGTSPPEWTGPGARIVVLRPPAEPATGKWASEVVDDSRHILHNFLVSRFDGSGGDDLVTASREGLTLFSRDAGGRWTQRLLASSSPGEVALGRVGGRRILATVEPWHGSSVVTYVEDAGAWKRQVIDDSIAGGHAIAWADFDGDGSDELVAGWRDKAVGLARYRVGPSGSSAGKEIVDDGVAVEDLVVADLNADGRPDIVAGGRSTANIRIYLNKAAR